MLAAADASSSTADLAGIPVDAAGTAATFAAGSFGCRNEVGCSLAHCCPHTTLSANLLSSLLRRPTSTHLTSLTAWPRRSRLTRAHVPYLRSCSATVGAVVAAMGPLACGRGWPAHAHTGRCRWLQPATGARGSPEPARPQRPAPEACAERTRHRRQRVGRPRDRPVRVVPVPRFGRRAGPGRPGSRGASGGSGAAAGGMGLAGRCPTVTSVVPDAPGTHGGGAYVLLYTHICPRSVGKSCVNRIVHSSV